MFETEVLDFGNWSGETCPPPPPVCMLTYKYYAYKIRVYLVSTKEKVKHILKILQQMMQNS